MNRFIITILSTLFIGNIYCQKWDQTFGLSGTDETFIDLLESYDKGYLLSGGYGNNTLYNWIIKTDINGNLLWDKTIVHYDHEFYSGYMDQNKSGDIIVGRALNLLSGTNWPSLVKMDACGNKLWCRTFIDDEFLWGWFDDLILLDSGDVIGLANMVANDNDDDDIWLFYIDKDGNLVWKKSISSISNHPLVMQRSGSGLFYFDNNYYVTGYCYYPHPSDPEVGYLRPFFIGIDSSFNEQWILPFGIDDWITGEAFSITQLNDSILMGIGFSWVEGDAQTILMYFNTSGEELSYSHIMSENIGQNYEQNLSSYATRINDTLFITSTTYGADDIEYDWGELIIDSSGNVYKSESRPNTRGDSKLIRTFDDKYVVGCTYELLNNKDLYLYKINDSLDMDTIYPGNYTYDSLCPYQIESGIIDISDCLIITDVSETPGPEKYFAGLNTIHIKALPNPTNTGSIKLQYSNTEQHSEMELRCFNIHGEEVHSERIYQHQGESLINVDSWPGGMYLAIVYSENKPVGRVKFVVR